MADNQEIMTTYKCLKQLLSFRHAKMSANTDSKTLKTTNQEENQSEMKS